MKTTKKILAALLVVIMLAMMIPFSASAAESYSVTITGKKDYTIDVYKIATVNTETGAYTDCLDAVKTILGTKASADGVNSEELLAACESATSLGTSVYNVKFDETATTTFTTETAGIYYIKVTGTPESVSVKEAGGAVVSLPYYDASAKKWVSPTSALELKLKDGDVNVDKKIVTADNNKVTSTTANIGDTITFELTASVTGSKEQPLTEYTIHDTMSDGLDNPVVTSVKVDDKTLTENTDYTVNATDLTDIKISLTEGYLNAAKAEEDNG
ncbi:MAG: isopeptide-forming domain-containing fimbrial protein, partial [Ruminococcus sp.]|nr:isopeptide-forming domain-containing fimbrial protein [Ruminococcus sp.]